MRSWESKFLSCLTDELNAIEILSIGRVCCHQYYISQISNVTGYTGLIKQVFRIVWASSTACLTMRLMFDPSGFKRKINYAVINQSKSICKLREIKVVTKITGSLPEH